MCARIEYALVAFLMHSERNFLVGIAKGFCSRKSFERSIRWAVLGSNKNFVEDQYSTCVNEEIYISSCLPKKILADSPAHPNFDRNP